VVRLKGEREGKKNQAAKTAVPEIEEVTTLFLLFFFLLMMVDRKEQGS